MKALKVSVYTSAPLFVEASADEVGKIFASADAGEQVAILEAMVRNMLPHQIQWDYVIMELERPENKETLEALRYVFKDSTHD